MPSSIGHNSDGMDSDWRQKLSAKKTYKAGKCPQAHV